MAVTPTASSQTVGVSKSLCQTVGVGTTETLYDRLGHAIYTNTYSCRNEGGATDGSVMTGTNILEVDANTMVGISHNGVLRKSSGMAVYQMTEDKMAISPKRLFRRIQGHV